MTSGAVASQAPPGVRTAPARRRARWGRLRADEPDDDRADGDAQRDGRDEGHVGLVRDRVGRHRGRAEDERELPDLAEPDRELERTGRQARGAREAVDDGRPWRRRSGRGTGPASRGRGTSASGWISVPIATKNRTAKRSRKGSRRRRASAASGLSVTARPPTNAARASGTPKSAEPTPASARPARDRDDQEQVVLGAQSRAGRSAAGARPPASGPGRRRARPPPGRAAARRAEEGQQDGRDRHARCCPGGRSSRAAPARSGGPSSAAGSRDVDDDDRRRQGDRQADQRGRRRREPGDEEDGAGDDGRDDRPGSAPPTIRPRCSRPDPQEVDLDADLEQEQDDAEVGQELELLAIGDVARRERRDDDARARDSRRPRAIPRAGRASRRPRRRAGGAPISRIGPGGVVHRAGW